MSKKRRMTQASERGEVLVAIMNNKRDFDILQRELWYRIPVRSAPRRWPPKWLAFYHTKVFEEKRYTIQYYGRVRREIPVVKRRELFPNEFPNPKSERQYYQIFLQSLERLSQPILSARARRIVFIPTTEAKFFRAEQINDLFDESPLEDHLWVELQKQDIPAERQWNVITQEGYYRLDFALFCVDANLDVETDGVSYHSKPERRSKDQERDNALQLADWRVLRFETQRVRESAAQYCMPRITRMISKLGGLKDEGLVPRAFYDSPDGVAQQLTMFEDEVEYDLD